MRLKNYLKVHANITNSALQGLFEDNKVLVNGQAASPLYQVCDNDIIMLDNKIIEKIDNKYFLYYKPRGIISDISDKDNSYSKVLNLSYKLMPAGRLDKDSEGLMLLTNDGKYIDFLLNPKTHVEKEYIITLKNIITNDFMERLKSIKEIDNKILKPFKITKIDSLTLSITLVEGKYHQIRKMVKMAFNEVITLKRIRIDQYMLGDMIPGELKEIKIAK